LSDGQTHFNRGRLRTQEVSYASLSWCNSTSPNQFPALLATV
jgi:hypothetical protein